MSINDILYIILHIALYVIFIYAVILQELKKLRDFKIPKDSFDFYLVLWTISSIVVVEVDTNFAPEPTKSMSLLVLIADFVIILWLFFINTWIASRWFRDS